MKLSITITEAREIVAKSFNLPIQSVEITGGDETLVLIGPSECLSEDEKNQVRDNNSIGAIKSVRLRLGTSLKESKDIVDSFLAKL